MDLSGNTLSLTNDGTTVDLSGYLDNTDAQDLTLTGNTLSLTGDGTDVDLSTVTLASGQISGLGTAATQDVGTAVNNVLQFATAATLPALNGSALTNLEWSNIDNIPGDIADGDDELSLPFSATENNASDLFNLTQEGAGRAGVFDVNNTGSNTPALEVSTNGGSGSYIARFMRDVGSAGQGIFVDMNGVNSNEEPAIQVTGTTTALQVFTGAAEGNILQSDASGNFTPQDGLTVNPEGRNNVFSQTLSGTGGSIDNLNAAANNVLLGRTIGGSIDDGSSNVMIGDIIAPPATDASNNVLLGTTVTTGLTSGSSNIALGNSPGGALTEGNENVLIGSNTYTALTTGSSNIGIGAGSGGTVVTTGSGNTSIGDGAEIAGALGGTVNNLAIGTGAQSGGGSTGNSVAIGTSSASGQDNSIAIGTSANAQGTNGVAIGAGASITTGNNNIAIGENASVGIVTGSIAFGHNASATSSGAVAIGEDAVAAKTNTLTVGSAAKPYALETTGARYVSVRSLSGTIIENVQDTDYILYLEGGTNGEIRLPAASAANVGRKLVICTASTGTNVDLRTQGDLLHLFFANGAQNSITIRREAIPGNGAIMSITVVLVAPNTWIVTGSEGEQF